jgi:hypothetical protein
MEPISPKSRFVGLDRGAATGAIYLIEASSETARLTRVDRDSAEPVYFEPSKFGPPGHDPAAAALAQTTDFVVDEVTGLVYFLTPDGLWKGELT